MAEEKLLTIRDVSLILNISEKQVVELAERGELPAYKIAGTFLRFKRQQIDEFRARLAHKQPQPGSQKPVIAIAQTNPNHNPLTARRPVVPRAHRLKGQTRYDFWERAKDFFYFNDFYIFAVIIIILILIIIFQGY